MGYYSRLDSPLLVRSSCRNPAFIYALGLTADFY